MAMTTTAAKRDYEAESALRFQLGMAVENLKLWAALTRSKRDDRILGLVAKNIRDDSQWDDIVTALLGE